MPRDQQLRGMNPGSTIVVSIQKMLVIPHQLVEIVVTAVRVVRQIRVLQVLGGVVSHIG